jgi:hypothetical protein
MPASAQPIDCCEIQLMNTRLASALFSSGLIWRGRTNWWEPAQTALVSPISGNGAAAHFSFLMAVSGVVFQGPPKKKAVLSLLKATKSDYAEVFLGLNP